MARPIAKLRLLDLFCGVGGCSVGYERAGFDVVGVDLVRQPEYPFEFIQANALTYPLAGFDAIHASPPCKAYTAARHLDQNLHLFDPYVDLVGATRDLLVASGVSWVIENVPGAPLHDPIVLCGSMFGLAVRRHRLFESNVALAAPPCDHRSQGAVVGVYGHGGAWDRGAQAGGGGGRKVAGADAAEALGIAHTIRQASLAQAIPPAYTEYIGRQLIAHLRPNGG